MLSLITIMKKTLFPLSLCFLISCQKNERNVQPNIIYMETPPCLLAQLKAGSSAEKSETDYSNSIYSEADLNCSVPVLESELKNKGYRFPSEEEFEKKVFAIFRRKLDFSLATQYVYIGGNDACTKSMVYNRNSDDGMTPVSYYLIKNKKFLTELFAIPEITDYKKNFPGTAGLEKQISNDQGDVKIVKWEEDPGLPKRRFNNINTIVSRNKYLFNDSKADLTWLLSNDKKFLRQLVIVYGYDTEEKINRQVLEELYTEYTRSGQIWRAAKIGDLFFTKDCRDKLQIRKGLLEYVSQHTTKDDDRFIYALGVYAHYLFKENSDLFETEPSGKFSIEEKAEIIARIAVIESPAFYKYKPLNSNTAWHNTGSVLHTITAAHPEILSMIIKNKYYGLPDLKEIIESVPFEEEASGAISADLSDY